MITFEELVKKAVHDFLTTNTLTQFDFAGLGSYSAVQPVISDYIREEFYTGNGALFRDLSRVEIVKAYPTCLLTDKYLNTDASLNCQLSCTDPDTLYLLFDRELSMVQYIADLLEVPIDDIKLMWTMPLDIHVVNNPKMRRAIIKLANTYNIPQFHEYLTNLSV